jgi:hypothetical protein
LAGAGLFVTGVVLFVFDSPLGASGGLARVQAAPVFGAGTTGFAASLRF